MTTESAIAMTEKEISDYRSFHQANFEEFSVYIKLDKRLTIACLIIEKGLHEKFTLEYVEKELFNHPDFNCLRNMHEAIWYIICCLEEEENKEEASKCLF